MAGDMWYEWRPYVPAAARRRQAERMLRKLGAKGQELSPVAIAGRTIARTFWGKAWCSNLERYSDYANRLPRGRSYVRNGAVLDLRITSGEVKALVSGTDVYQVGLKVSAVPQRRWSAICKDCAGAIDSLVELLQGRFSNGVMERICRLGTGLFPAPDEIRLSCSCPDWASMCKHVAAVLYGIGARLDEQPGLLFTLREVHEQDLISKAGNGGRLAKSGPAADRVLGGKGLSELFGLEMAVADGAEERRPLPRARAKAGSPARGRAPAGPAKKRSTSARRLKPGPVRNGRRKAGKARSRTPKVTRVATPGRLRWPPGKARLEALIADATVDAYGESEQRTGLFTSLEEHLALPFDTRVLGDVVTVARVDLMAADEIVAVCRRGAKRQRIPILDLRLPTPPPAGAEWIEAYRRWARGA
jgi:hypothetical protein